MAAADESIVLDSDDEFNDEILAQLDAIDAAHATQSASAAPTQSTSTAMRDNQPQPADDDDFDMTFDIDDSILDAIDPPVPSTSAQPAPPRTLARTTSQTVQTTLTGEPFNAAGSSNKPRAMPKAGKFSKTKKWDHTAFAKSGQRSKKKKGEGKVNNDHEETVEFEQFPAPFVPVGQVACNSTQCTHADLPFLGVSPFIRAPQPMKPQVDRLSARQWIFPLNREKRDYQRAIAEAALFENTLVALPTGLGKTFIAGVVMLNFYLWFPTGKIIFVAPTKPLVAQQIVACHEVCGIPGQYAAEMHGDIKATKRAQLWEQKRVFYMTPQTLQNDITSENFDIRDVVLLVVDEAHRATGEYAYCTVVRHLMAKNPHFRVLALTATPSSDKDKIQPIVDALHISHIEIRSEASPDIVPYIKKKVLTKHVIEIPPDLAKLRDGLAKVMLPMIKKVPGVLFGTQDPVYLKSFSCKAAADRSRGNKNLDAWVLPTLNNLRTLATTMGYLLEYSPRLALEHLNTAEAVTSNGAARPPPRYKDTREYKTFLADFRRAGEGGAFIHPKMEKLRALLIDYFVRAMDDDEHSKAMVFVSFRSCVEEIVEFLNKDQPLIRATKFIGQGDDKSGKKGLSQKEQLKTIERFKKDEFNVLISTSIGEEGLDIGEVDLIVCYETTSSAIRSLQRAGRTGRKRDGRLDLLMTEGREEANWDKSTEKYEDVQYAIRMAQLELYCDVERLLPPDVTPTCVERPMEIEKYERVTTATKGGDEDGAPAKKGAKKKKDPQRNVPEGATSGFVAASQLVPKGSGKKRKKGTEDDDDDEVDERPKKTTKKAKKQEEELTYSQVMAEVEDDDAPKKKAVKKSSTSKKKKAQPTPELSYSQVMAEVNLSDDEGPRPAGKGKAKAKATVTNALSRAASTAKTASSRATSRAASGAASPSSQRNRSVIDLCDSSVSFSGFTAPPPPATAEDHNWILSDCSDVDMLPPSPRAGPTAPFKPSLAFQSARTLIQSPERSILDSDVEVVASTPARRSRPLSPSVLMNTGPAAAVPGPSFRKPAVPASRPQAPHIPSSPDLFTQAVRAPGQATRRVRAAADISVDESPAPSASQARLQKFKCPRVRKAADPSAEDDAGPIIASQSRMQQFYGSQDSSPPPRPPVKRHRVRADPLRRRERNALVDALAVHSGDEENAGDTSASDMEEDEEDRRFVTELGATQADPEYEQSLVYRQSLFTQAPAGGGPAFRKGPVRTDSHLNARERGRKRAPGVSSSPPRDPDCTLSDYDLDDSFIVRDDDLLALSSET